MKKGLKFTRGERQLKRILETPLLPQGKATVAVSSEAVDTIKALKRTGYDEHRVQRAAGGQHLCPAAGA